MKEIRNRLIGIAAIAVASIILILVVSLFRRNRDAQPVQTSGTVTEQSFAMGTAVTLTLYGDDGVLKDVSGSILEHIRTLDQDILSWRSENSELARWNREAKAGERTKVDHKLAYAVNQSLLISEETSGALDITLRPVLDEWGIEEKTQDTFQVPSEDALKKAAARRAGVGDLWGTDDFISRSREDILIDLGAVGKGYALDKAYDLLYLGDQGKIYYAPESLKNHDMPVAGGVLAVGGSVMVFGSKPDRTDFRVGIRDPEGLPDDIVGYISIPSGTDKMCVSTSGGYEKYIEKDGVKYHHIIDPSTLHPADSGLRSVTVVCANGLVSDGLSTACFILGEQKSLSVLSFFHAEGVFIREDGTTHVTPGLEGKVTWTK